MMFGPLRPWLQEDSRHAAVRTPLVLVVPAGRVRGVQRAVGRS
jgi:hypothetical protein